MKRTILALVLVGSAVLAGCSSDSDDADSTTSTTAAETTTSAADEGGTVVDQPGPIELAVGEQATIRLETNPTTGYQWEPAGAPDDSIIAILSDRYEAADSNVVGSGGMQEIVIEAVGAGSTTLELNYVRPWESGVAPAETASYTITVE